MVKIIKQNLSRRGSKSTENGRMGTTRMLEDSK